MFKYLIVLLALVSASVVYGQRQTPFSRCSGNEALPRGVTFPNCNVNGQFCELRAGQQIVVRVEFSPARTQARAINAALHTWNGSRWQEWSLGLRTNVCEFLTRAQTCPINVGERRTYELRTRIPWNVQLGVRHALHIRLQDQAGNSVACVEIAALFSN